LHQQNPPVLNWRRQLKQVDLYIGLKTAVVVVVVVDIASFSLTFIIIIIF